MVDDVGDVTKPPLDEENRPPLEAFGGPEPSNTGLPGAWDWKGSAADGTLRRRPDVRDPEVYMLWERECEVVGEARPGPHRGLPCPIENVDEVGVLNSLGEDGRYM